MIVHYQSTRLENEYESYDNNQVVVMYNHTKHCVVANYRYIWRKKWLVFGLDVVEYREGNMVEPGAGATIANIYMEGWEFAENVLIRWKHLFNLPRMVCNNSGLMALCLDRWTKIIKNIIAEYWGCSGVYLLVWDAYVLGLSSSVSPFLLDHNLTSRRRCGRT